MKIKTTLLLKITVSLFVLTTALFLSSTAYDYFTDAKEMRATAHTAAENVTRRLPDSIAYALFNFDEEQVRFIVDRLLQEEPAVVGVKVIENGETSLELAKGVDDVSLTYTLEAPILFDDGGDRPVDIGKVEVTFTTEHIERLLGRSLMKRLIENLVQALIVVLVNSLILLRIVIRPVRETSRMLRNIAQGDGDLTKHLSARTHDETGDLARYFNEFVDKLRESVRSIQTTLLETVKAKDDLTVNTEESVAAVNEMTANIVSTKTQMEKLNGTIGEFSEATSRIETNVEKTMEFIRSQGSMVEETTAAVTQMLASIDNVKNTTQNRALAMRVLVETAETGGTKLDQTSEVISATAQNIGEIDEMLSIINGIASQTNLLSMNAAIEAAHAGESGKGFAVVAEEIRKLAESSAESAKNISSILKNMISRIESAASLSGETQTAFQKINGGVREVADSFEGITDAMAEMSSGSEQIREAMVQLSDASREVMSGSEEMRSSVRVFSGSISNVRNISDVVSGAMSELASGTNEINTAMMHVATVGTRLAENTERLRTEIVRFRIDGERAGS